MTPPDTPSQIAAQAIVTPSSAGALFAKVGDGRRSVHFDDKELADLRAVRSILQESSLEDFPLEERRERRRQSSSVIAHALSGMVGSIIAELLLFPVDQIKMIVQTSSAGETAGFLGTLARVARTQGLAGFYKGIGVSVFKESVLSMNYWMWHGLLFRKLTRADDTSKTPLLVRLGLGMIAKQLNWLCTTPLEVVSAVNQLSPTSPGFFATAAALYRQEGLGAFYRGLTISLVLSINPAIMNTLITSLLRATAAFRMLFLGQDYETARDYGPAVIGLATAISKFVATAGTYPLIRAKVLQQVSAQKGVMDIWHNIMRTEGVAGFYRGLLPMSYKTVCWNAVMMMFKHALGPKRATTPPATPPRLDAAALLPPMPWMGRMPFPAELVTAEKLDQILSYIKTDPGRGKVQKMEHRMNQMAHEIKEVKGLLAELVQHLGGVQAGEGPVMPRLPSA